jgi:hypothetical protein
MFTKNDIGCYFDGARGYASQGILIQKMAMEYGMENFERVDNPESEYFDDAVDTAIDYLNTLTDGDVLFEFNNGDFGLYAVQEAI